MVSHLPLPGLPRFTLREPGYNLLKLLALIVALIFMVINPPRNMFPVMAALVVAGFTAGADPDAGPSRRRGNRTGRT